MINDEATLWDINVCCWHNFKMLLLHFRLKFKFVKTFFFCILSWQAIILKQNQDYDLVVVKKKEYAMTSLNSTQQSDEDIPKHVPGLNYFMHRVYMEFILVI